MNSTMIFISQASYTCAFAAFLMIHLTVGVILTPATPRQRADAAAARKACR